MASVQLVDVVKRYGKGDKAVQVIHGVSAAIANGEFVVIVGPSGCGKSTLLRMVAGLEEISAGELRIGERVVNHVQPAERDIAMVFQNYALYPHMSVFENMAYGLKIRKLGEADIRARVDKAAAILELSHLLQRKPGQLSGGQRQRVAMGRAIVREPQVFLFDEPLSNLDAKLRAQTRLEIQKLHADLGITSLFVTHDQVEAMTLAQRMMVLSAGRVEQFGTPLEMYDTPASTFVAGFIGAPPMNLLAMNSGAARAVLTAQNADLPTNSATLGVRPEHLRVAAGGLALRVEMLEMLGAERLIYGTTQGDGTAQSVIVRVDESVAMPTVGTTVHVQAVPGKLHGFDADGRRV